MPGESPQGEHQDITGPENMDIRGSAPPPWAFGHLKDEWWRKKNQSLGLGRFAYRLKNFDYEKGEPIPDEDTTFPVPDQVTISTETSADATNEGAQPLDLPQMTADEGKKTVQPPPPEGSPIMEAGTEGAPAELSPNAVSAPTVRIRFDAPEPPGPPRAGKVGGNSSFEQAYWRRNARQDDY